MSLCKFKDYADIFGKPNEGIHSTRIGGYAFVDILGTLIIAVLLSYYCNLNIFNTKIKHSLRNVETLSLCVKKAIDWSSIMINVLRILKPLHSNSHVKPKTH